MSGLENKEGTNPEKLNDWPSQKNSWTRATYDDRSSYLSNGR